MSYKLNNFSEVYELLKEYVPPAKSFRGVYVLERMQKLMVELGNPQNSYRSIHVAGTSGKTSTSYYIASLLQAAGQKVGLTVSPHIDEVNERVQINLQPLPEKRFCRELSKFLNLVDKTGIKPTYFELLAAFAFWHFAQEKVDYAVIEVGLGGLLDGTNVMNREDKVCVITDIGLDHVAVLGDTIAAIAAQKAGIIRPRNSVFVYVQEDAVMKVVREASEQQHADLHIIKPLKRTALPNQMPLYQRRNWHLAYMAYSYLCERDGLIELKESQLAKTRKVHIPGRMEVLQIQGKILVMDGAHNSQKMQALVSTMHQRFKNKTIAVMFSLVENGDYRTLSTLRELINLARHLIITQFDVQEDFRKQSVKAEKVASYCEQLKFNEYKVIIKPEAALKQLLSRNEDILLITGSFYLLNYIRPVLWKHDPTHRSNRS